MTDWAVGQTVLLHGRNTPTEVEVSKVGRTLVYIREYGRDRPFRKEDGVQNDHKYGYADVLYTKEQWAARERRSAVVEQLKKLGITSAGYGGFDYSTDTLEAVSEVLSASLPGTDKENPA